ncbi:hypothetical protein R1T16_15450 [Flavobacterium sp. DG1-102-2]|uniref:hypothetical protein n=1 Tax=Flavobacterium sp. DG1-102-2 TaxID=3081663 RepID=UPI0029490BC1|nr:hypothetical protein [Flavobacterium sp. DG1-102-2]MDV6169832.1 hypothetical protein [Flavobacterium sp. DG1-102-2]
MKKWVKQSIGWTLYNTLISGIIIPYADRSEFNVKNITIALCISAALAFSLGYFWIRKRELKKLHHEKMG